MDNKPTTNPDPVMQVSSLDASQVSVAKAKNKSHQKLWEVVLVIFSLAVLAVVAGIIWNIWSRHAKDSQQTARTNQSQSIDLGQISDASSAFEVSDSDKVVINGQLQASNTLLLTPTSEPDAPEDGQVYIDQTTNQMRYYNGQQFITVASNTDLQTLQNQIQTVNNTVNSLGNTAATAGGVISLQGSAGAINMLGTGGLTITAGGNTVTVALPQNLTTTASPVFDGLTLGGLAANGVVITDGSSGLDAITPGAPGLCLVSNGSNLPTFGSCVSGAVGTLNSLAGTLFIGSNNLVVSDDGIDTITIDAPQGIGITDTPTFAGLDLDSIGGGTVSFRAASTAGNFTLTVPAETGKLCTDDLTNTSFIGSDPDYDSCYDKFASSSGSGAYIQFAPNAVQQDNTCVGNPSCTTSTIWVGKNTVEGDILRLQGVATNGGPLNDALVLNGDGTMFFRSLVNNTNAFQIQNAGGDTLLNFSTVPVPNLLSDPTFDVGSTLPILPEISPGVPDPYSGTGLCISPACWIPLGSTLPTAVSAPTLGWDSTNSYDTTGNGNGSLRIVNQNGVGGSNWVSGAAYPIALAGGSSGTKYTLTAYAKAVEAGKTPERLYGGWYTGANLNSKNDCARVPVTYLNIYGYTWFKYQCTFTVPASTTTTGIYFRTTTRTNANQTVGVYWIDKVIIQQGDPAPISNGLVSFNDTPLTVNFAGEQAFELNNQDQGVTVLRVDADTGKTTFQAVTEGAGILTVNSVDQQYILRLDSGASGSTTGRWETGSGLPYKWEPYQTAQANVIGGTFAYVAGGEICSLTGTCSPTITSKVYYSRLNGTDGNDSWVGTHDLPAAVTGQAVVTAKGRIYVIGGSNDGTNAVGTVYYNTINSVTGGVVDSTWTTSSATGFTPRMLLKAVYYNGYIYAIGGAPSLGGTGMVTVQRAKVNADGSLGNWVADDGLPVGRKGFGIAQAGGYLYAVGGQATSPTNTIYYAQVGANGDLSSWNTSGNTLPSATGDTGNRSYLDTAIYTSPEGTATLYALGGRTSNPPSASAAPRFTAFFSQIDSTTGDVGAFTTSYITDASNVNYPRNYAGTAVADGAMYFIGGTAGGRRSEVLFVPLNGTPNKAFIGGTLDVSSGANIAGGLSVKPVGMDASDVLTVKNLADETVFNIDTKTDSITLGQNNSADLHNWSVNQSAFSVANAGLGSTIVNGYAYAIGGNGVSVLYAKVNADGSLGAWTSTNAPAGFSSYNRHNMVTSANGFIYILGGFTPGSDPAATNNIYFAKPAADGTINNWRDASSAVESSFPSVGAAAVAVYNNKLYVIGGATNTADNGVTPDTPNTTNPVRYAQINSDGTLGTFTVASNSGFPAAGRMGAQAAVSNGYLYVTGGDDGTGATGDVYYIKLSGAGVPTGNWSSVAVGLDRAYHASFVANGYLYLIGGYSGNTYLDTPTDQVIYGKINSDGSVGDWTVQDGEIMFQPIADFGYMFANGFFYVLGGSDGTTAQTVINYATTSRVKVGGSLDLVGLGSQTLSDSGGGGLLTAGNTTIVGTLDVRDSANFTQSVVVGGNLTSFGNFLLQPNSDSTTAFQVQNTNGIGVAAIDTANGQLVLGQFDSTNPVNGQLAFANDATNFRVVLQSGQTNNSSADLVLTLPTADGASGHCLKTDGSGALSFSACVGGGGSGGVESLQGLQGGGVLDGILKFSNMSSDGVDTFTIDNAKADGATKGIATFDTQNFDDNGAGLISLSNDVQLSGTLQVVSGAITTNSITSTSDLTIGNTGFSLALQGDELSTLAVDDGSFSTTIGFNGAATADVVYNFDRTAIAGSYTICTTANFDDCMSTGGGGSGDYIQNQFSSAQSSAGFWISNTGRADIALQAPLFDTATAATLNVGTTNATDIALNKSTTITGDLTFTTGADRTISVATQTTLNTAGNKLTVIAATGNGNGAGGELVLQGGVGGGGNGNGGKVSITGGADGFSGTGGMVEITGGGPGGLGTGGAVNITGGSAGTSGAGHAGALTVSGGSASCLCASNGGALTLQGGSAGSGSGGDVTINGGSSNFGSVGGTVSIQGGTSSNSIGAAVNITGGTGGTTGGAVTIKGGSAGGSSTGGLLTLQGGDGGSTGNGGGITLSTGMIGNGSGTTNGTVTINSADTIASVATNGTAASNILTVTGVVGGATSGTSGQIGGAGSAISLTAGAGGASTGATGTNVGGAGGAITLQAGTGGNATSASAAPGTGGVLTLQSGAAGTGGNFLANGGAINVTSGAGLTSGAVTVASGGGGVATGAVTFKSGNSGSGSSGVVTISSGNASSAASGALTVSTGTGTTSTGALTVSSGNASAGTSGTLTLQSGAGASGSGDVSVNSGNISTTGNSQSSGALSFQSGEILGANVAVAQTNLTSGTLNIGSGRVGMNNASSTGTTGDLNLFTGNAGGGFLNNGVSSGSININVGAPGSSGTKGSINIGTTRAATEINLGAVDSSTFSSDIHIADTGSGTGTQSVTIGSTVGTSNNVTLQGGSIASAVSLLTGAGGGISVATGNNGAGNSGNIILGTGTATGTAGSVIVRNATDSTTSFRVQNAAGTTTLFNVGASDGVVTLRDLSNVQTMYFNRGLGASATSSDIFFTQSGVMAAQNSLYLTIDSDNDTTNAAFVILKDAENTVGTELFRVGEDGNVGIGTAGSPSARLHVTGGSGTAVASIINNGTSTGNILQLQDNGSSVVTISDGGSALFKPSTGNDSATAFQIQDSNGTAFLTADSSNLKITVTNLEVTANLTVNGHIISGGSTPTYSAGIAACTSPSISISGTDTAGSISITAGTGCTPPTGSIVQVNFAAAYGAAPKGIILTPANDKASAIDFYSDVTNTTTAHFTIDTSSVLSDAETYKFNYIVIQ